MSVESFTKSATVKVRIRPSTLETLQKIAYLKDMRLSEYLRYALDRQIEQELDDESD